MREGERGANRRCGPVRPPDGATSQRRVDDHYPLHLSPFPPAAQPNIDRGCMHGAGCFACRSGGGGEMRRRRLATPLHAARERPAPLCTTARPSVLGDWSTGREIGAFADCTPGWPPCLLAFCPSECVRAWAGGRTVVRSISPSPFSHSLPPRAHIFPTHRSSVYRIRDSDFVAALRRKSLGSITSLSLRREEEG